MLDVEYAVHSVNFCAMKLFPLDWADSIIVRFVYSPSSKIPTLKLYSIDLSNGKGIKSVCFLWLRFVLYTVLCHTICIQLVQLNERILKMKMVTVDKVTKNAHTNLLTGHLPNWLFSQWEKWEREKKRVQHSFRNNKNNYNNNNSKKPKQQQ